MTRRYPNQSLGRHFNLHKQRMSVYGLSLHLGNSESSKIVEQKLIFHIGTPNPHDIKKRFSLNYLVIVFFVTVFPPIA